MIDPLQAGRRGAGVGALRVLFVQDHLGQSADSIHGVTRYLLSTLSAFDPDVVQPCLSVLTPRHAIGERLFEAEGVRPLFLGRPKWDPRALVDLIRVVRERDIDVLHLSGLKATILGRLAARAIGCAAIVHVHDARPMPPWVRRVQHGLAGWTHAAVAVSAAMRRVAIEEYGLPPERVEVVHNGVRPEPFARVAAADGERVRHELGLAADAAVVGMLGRIEAGKGLEVMLRAMPEVISRCPGAVLLVVGDGPMRPECQRLATTLGVVGSVRFAGYRGDVPAVLTAMDVMAAPSLVEEGLGYAVLEAMCAGVPVVASLSGGLPEVVSHGESGLLVPKGDVAGLAEALVRVLSEQSLHEALSTGARRRVGAFSVERHAKRLQEVYRAVANNSRPTPRPPGRRAAGPSRGHPPCGPASGGAARSSGR